MAAMALPGVYTALDWARFGEIKRDLGVDHKTNKIVCVSEFALCCTTYDDLSKPLDDSGNTLLHEVILCVQDDPKDRVWDLVLRALARTKCFDQLCQIKNSKGETSLKYMFDLSILSREIIPRVHSYATLMLIPLFADTSPMHATLKHLNDPPSKREHKKWTFIYATLLRKADIVQELFFAKHENRPAIDSIRHPADLARLVAYVNDPVVLGHRYYQFSRKSLFTYVSDTLAHTQYDDRDSDIVLLQKILRALADKPCFKERLYDATSMQKVIQCLEKRSQHTSVKHEGSTLSVSKSELAGLA